MSAEPPNSCCMLLALLSCMSAFAVFVRPCYVNPIYSLYNPLESICHPYLRPCHGMQQQLPGLHLSKLLSRKDQKQHVGDLKGFAQLESRDPLFRGCIRIQKGFTGHVYGYFPGTYLEDFGRLPQQWRIKWKEVGS